MEYSLTFALIVAFPIIYQTCLIVYNLFFHPLRSFPGPKSWAASDIRQTISLLCGQLSFDARRLHDNYGEVVRIAPNQLSFNSARAWQEIYGHVTGSEAPRFEKDSTFYVPTLSGVPNIINANGHDHRRLRKLQSHAFSEKALAAQESIMQNHLLVLVKKLKEQCQSPAEGLIALNQWYNFTTFDLIGDLAFGEPFGLTEQGAPNEWVTLFFRMVKMGSYMRAASNFPTIIRLSKMLIPISMVRSRARHSKWSAEKAARRIRSGVERPDFFSYMLKNNGKQGGKEEMTEEEMKEAASILIIAGSETTATMLTGATYHLLSRPETYLHLKNEIRSAFQSQEDITLRRLAQLPYLNACLDEGLRIFPPVPTTLPRIVPRHGATLCNHFVPQGTTVGVNQWAAMHCESNFRDPETFAPERWLGEDYFANDQRTARQPFSVGPRNCIGRNLATAEMRLLLASVLWNFDLELAPESKYWSSETRVFIMWERPNLMVKLTLRKI